MEGAKIAASPRLRLHVHSLRAGQRHWPSHGQMALWRHAPRCARTRDRVFAATSDVIRVPVIFSCEDLCLCLCQSRAESVAPAPTATTAATACNLTRRHVERSHMPVRYAVASHR